MASIHIPRILNLDLPEDVRTLRHAAVDVVGLLPMVDEHLDRYREWFPEAHWKTIYSGGMISIPVSRRHGSSYELLQMLNITATMESLSNCPGFQELISGFRNPTQIAATMFEVSVAEWCQARAVTQALEFAPHVTVRNHSKRPDILWDTTLGRLYCECKSSHFFQQGRRQTGREVP